MSTGAGAREVKATVGGDTTICGSREGYETTGRGSERHSQRTD
jgi:hypothetical protein